MALVAVMALFVVMTGFKSALGHAHSSHDRPFHIEGLIEDGRTSSLLESDGLEANAQNGVAAPCGGLLPPDDGPRKADPGCDCACHSLARVPPLGMSLVAPAKASFDRAPAMALVSSLAPSIDDPPIILAIL